MPTFTRRLLLPGIPAAELFAWHERPGAFARLTPPWVPVRVVRRSGEGIRDGARLVLNVPVGPLRMRWELEHRGYVAGREFRDVQVAGPFAAWEHVHCMAPAGGGHSPGSVLDDTIHYRLPLGGAGELAAGWLVRRQLARLLAHRHAVTAADLERHARFADQGARTIAITGSTGLIGAALADYLTTAGHRVRRLVRPGAPAGADAIPWDPDAGSLDPARLEGVDAVVHLAGEPVSERWTGAHKRAILDSRVQGTRTIARALAALAALAALDARPRVLVSASAMGYYGDGGDHVLDEASPPGRDFLASVAQAWEAEAEPARAAGIRVVHPRFGVVLSAKGGALARLLPPFLVGGGGRLGSGRQWMSWIALDDVLGALEHLLFTDALEGPVNLVAPAPATNAEFADTLARVLGRPALLTVPAAALRLMFGEMADAMLLAGQRVRPSRLIDSGFAFRHPTLEEALRYELGR